MRRLLELLVPTAVLTATMSSSDGILTSDKFGDGDGKGVPVSTLKKKECTSCEQKINDCKLQDGASDNTSGSSSCNYDINAVVEGISKVDMSNDDNDTVSENSADWLDRVQREEDEELFREPPALLDCEICMLPVPHSIAACGPG